MKRIFWVPIVLLSIVLFISGCNLFDPNIAISPSNAAVDVGQSQKFDATDENGNSRSIYWSLSGSIGYLSNDYGASTTFYATTPGTGRIEAKKSDGTLLDYSIVSVVDASPVLSSISLNLSSWIFLLDVSSPITYVATGYDQYGNVMDINPIWSLSNAVGTLSRTAGTSSKFTPTAIGEANLVASVGALSASSSIRVIKIASFSIVPSSASLNIGEEVTFSTRGIDTNGASYIHYSTWSISNDIGTLTPIQNLSNEENTHAIRTVDASFSPEAEQGWRVTFKATKNGAAELTADFITLSAKASIAVGSTSQVLTRIAVTPTPKTVNRGNSQVFTATGYDQNNNVMTINPAPTWSVTGGIGSVSPNSGITTTFSATTVGTGTVKAMSGAINGIADVTVVDTPVLSSIVITPPSVTVKKGETQDFTATGYDQNNNVITINPAPTWSVTGGIGTVSPNSGTTTTFSATAVGTGSVKATCGSVNGSAGATVVETQILTSIIVTPSPRTVYLDKTKVFTATGYDQNNNVMIINPSPTWSVTGGIGTVSPTNGATTTFSATSVGVGKVWAISNSINGAADVTVELEPSVATSLSIEPTELTTYIGETTTFNAYIFDQYGNTMDLSPTWWGINGGVGTRTPSSGSSTAFTATSIGSGTIFANYGSISCTVPISVIEEPVPTVVEISPSSWTMTSASKVFTTTVKDQKGNDITSSCWFSASVTGSGSFNLIMNTVEYKVTSANSSATLTITATNDFGNKSGTVNITIPASTPKSVSIDPPAWTMKVGESKTFYASVRDQYGLLMPNHKCDWVIDDKPESTPSSSITINAIEPPGDSVLKAIAGSATGTSLITVLAKPKPSSVTLDPSSYSMIDEDMVFTVSSVKDQYGGTIPLSSCSYSWRLDENLDSIGNLVAASSSNAKWYEVTSSNITSSVTGKIYVTVTYNGYSKEVSCSITVPICTTKTVVVSGSSASMEIDTQRDFSATCYCQYEHEHGTRSVTWGVAGGINGSFSPSSGTSTTFTARRAGSGQITATSSNGKIGTLSLEVSSIQDYKSDIIDPLLHVKIGPDKPYTEAITITDSSDILRRDIPEGAVITKVVVETGITYEVMQLLHVQIGCDASTSKGIIWNYQEADSEYLYDREFTLYTWNGLPARNRTFAIEISAIHDWDYWYATGYFKYVRFTIYWRKSVHPGY